MKESLFLALSIAFIVLMLVFSVWWQVYAFMDCKNVGHSTLYCVMRIGK